MVAICRLSGWSATLGVVLNLCAAPVPKETAQEPSLYFPIKIGTKWVHGSGASERMEMVTGIKQKENERVWVVTISTVDSKGMVAPNSEWEVSDQGLVLTKTEGVKELNPQCYLKLPHKPGEKWEFGSESKEFQCVALEPKRIKVPAGEFDAIGVELHAGKAVFETRWYAIGVGLVKIDRNEKTVWALKSFTPVKR